MKKSKFVLLAMACLAIASTLAFSQSERRTYGVGVNFGGAIPSSDIRPSRALPFGRAFLRYYPATQVGLEVGLGMGTLEAGRDSFFSSMIYPFDIRLVLQPFNDGKVNPYFFGGVGLMYFDPVDAQTQRLPRNANREYSRITGFFPAGVGAQYFVSKNTALGVCGTYNLSLTDNLDDIKVGGKDGFWNVTATVFAYLRGENDDLDGDGLLNKEEIELGTDPNNPDTDGEGLTDGEEVKTYLTSPLKPDTDDDGLNDKEEIFTHKTNPLNPDTDDDGLKDGEEVLTYRTDPLKADTDGDGLHDGDEVLKYHTDPLRVDTDGDTLGDGEEVLRHTTDPLKRDTDGDVLPDNDELNKYKTNPLVADTDKGGVDDGKEVQLALNPLDASDDVPVIKIGERIILEGVNFESAKTALLPSARSILDQVASSLLSSPEAEVAIHGHTDNVGGAKYNMDLSLGRAEAVKSYLVSKGVAANRVATKGFGFVKPVADNGTADGRARNRRIEFMRVK